MGNETLSAALEREHHEIDAGIEAFTAIHAALDTAPLKRALEGCAATSTSKRSSCSRRCATRA